MPIDVAKAWHSPVESRGSSEVSASSRRIIRISDYSPESPKNPVAVFSQNGGLTEFILNLSIKCHWRMDG